MKDSNRYKGNELELFNIAENWKHYWISKVDKYIGKRVLEVGAGIGGTTRHLVNIQRDFWLSLEPDEDMLNFLKHQKVEMGVFPKWCEFRLGKVFDLEKSELFDSIIYIDVLEHIKDDLLELERAAEHLVTSGYLIVLSPAYPYLFNEFDAAIGHFRRYTRESLPYLENVRVSLIESFYLDSVGLLASLFNKLFLHSPQPSTNQIAFWDNYIIPISKVIDPIHRFSAGRSIIAVWQKL